MAAPWWRRRLLMALPVWKSRAAASSIPARSARLRTIRPSLKRKFTPHTVVNTKIMVASANDESEAFLKSSIWGA